MGFSAPGVITWDSSKVQPNFVVGHAYQRVLFDEVTLNVGDKIFVAEIWPDGWYFGENLDSNEAVKASPEPHPKRALWPWPASIVCVVHVVLMLPRCCQGNCQPGVLTAVRGHWFA